MITILLLAIYYVVCMAGSLYFLARDSFGDGSISLFGFMLALVFAWGLPFYMVCYGLVRLLEWTATVKVWKPKNRNRNYRMQWAD